ncbi:MAG: DUF488 domain-containing protein [Dehalococcoidales bacterium]|nr:DUF488 domain-containing protein [Dehalococcoidales bacterium]
MSSGENAVLTIGHSTRTIEAFAQLLKENGVRVVIDVRTIPRSRHNPQFNQDSLPASLSAAGIGYRHMAGLGGLRRGRRPHVLTPWAQMKDGEITYPLTVGR